MPRVKRGTVRRAKRKKLLGLAKGYYANKSKLYRAAKESVDTALKYAFVGRRRKKRDFRRLWVVRINAAARENGLTYGQLINGLNSSNVLSLEKATGITPGCCGIFFFNPSQPDPRTHTWNLTFEKEFMSNTVARVRYLGRRSELKQALTQLAGGVARPLQELREDLLNLLADVEAALDFSDEDLQFVAQEDLLRRLAKGLALVTLAGKHLVRLVLSGERVVAEERLLEDLNQRIRGVEQGPDDALYVLVDGNEGKILKLMPKR